MRLSRSTLRRDVLFPDHYTWLVFVAALDIMLTCMILYRGGKEINTVALWFIHHYGLTGLVFFKYAMVVIVIVLCEIAGHLHPDWGRRLAIIAIAINCVPVACGFGLMLLHLGAW